MEDEFAETTLGRLLSFANGRSSPERADVLPYPVYGSNGVIGHAAEANADAGSIVIGRVGSYCGSLYLSRQRCWVTDNAIRATAIDNNDSRFLFYLLGTLTLNNWRAGSGQPLLNQDILSRIPASVPEPTEQRAIAHILGTLDDKIELKRRMNETLEALARALFKSWFADFDPVRAKAEGREPDLPQPLADLFPDSFEDSELGDTPKGWRVGALEDIASVTMGLSPDGASYNVDGVGTPLINGPVEFGDHFPVNTKWTTSPTRLAQVGDLILCVRGSTTGRRVVADDLYCLGRGVCAIRAKAGTRAFLYQVVNTSLDRLLSKTTGSVFPNLSAPDIKGLHILVPPPGLIDAFTSIAKPLTERAEANVGESHTLATLRDALLPKLISGELRVNDAERFLTQDATA